ncbi:hypothetical protein VZT92_002169 [Zoarces viviparus]|uniref:B30.2/SPRY domain-containing protein n=1 Tax=Zoarces viviparus TaxID=48416 RepID=A0AAW1FYZ6_ZOAVI
MASDLSNVAALGRPFTLGTLYDARKETLIPGLTLWDDTTLQGKITESVQPYSHFEITESDTIESKSSLLEVEASLKVSFLCGLIEVGGSAKYLNDQKKFKNQSRVTCQYKSTTHYKQLSMIDLVTLDAHQMEVIKKSSATHVVTGILYGANSFFVFDSQKLDASSVQNIQGSMKAVINKIPSLSPKAKAGIELTDEETALTDTCSCKFFGDFILNSIPVTFEEAVKTCGQLPQLLGEKGENAVPVKVWLTPLKNLIPEAAELKSGISDGLVGKMQEPAELISGISVGLVGKMQDALEDLREIQMRCNDSLEDGVLDNFPYIHEKFKTFQKLCDHYASDLQQNMAKKLPSIREGKEDESSLEGIFEDREKSPFSREKLSKWLDDKEREINVIRSCVDIMEGTKIVQTQSELDREVLDGDVDHALCFVFTSMMRGDTDLDVMATYLDSTEIKSTTEDQWFSSDAVFTTMREKAKAFRDLARARKNNKRFRFLIAVIPNEEHQGATIYHYKEGIVVSEDFSKPHLHSEQITDRRDLTWHACDLTLDPNTAQNDLILSDGNKRATSQSAWRSYPDHPERFDTHTQVLCKEGLSGCHYWELEWGSGSPRKKSIYAAVAYKRIDRKGGGLMSSFGQNTISWAFGQYDNVIYTLGAYHEDKVKIISIFHDNISTLGVYLDWPAGTLSFYKVSSDTLRHLYTFHTTFTEPVYPGLYIHNTNNYVYLRPLQ